MGWLKLSLTYWNAPWGEFDSHWSCRICKTGLVYMKVVGLWRRELLWMEECTLCDRPILCCHQKETIDRVPLLRCRISTLTRLTIQNGQFLGPLQPNIQATALQKLRVITLETSVAVVAELCRRTPSLTHLLLEHCFESPDIANLANPPSTLRCSVPLRRVPARTSGSCHVYLQHASPSFMPYKCSNLMLCSNLN